MGFFLFHEFNFTHGNQNTNLISKYRFPIFVLQRAHRKNDWPCNFLCSIEALWSNVSDVYVQRKKLKYDIYTDLKWSALRFDMNVTTYVLVYHVCDTQRYNYCYSMRILT